MAVGRGVRREGRRRPVGEGPHGVVQREEQRRGLVGRGEDGVGVDDRVVVVDRQACRAAERDPVLGRGPGGDRAECEGPGGRPDLFGGDVAAHVAPWIGGGVRPGGEFGPPGGLAGPRRHPAVPHLLAFRVDRRQQERVVGAPDRRSAPVGGAAIGDGLGVLDYVDDVRFEPEDAPFGAPTADQLRAAVSGQLRRGRDLVGRDRLGQERDLLMPDRERDEVVAVGQVEERHSNRAAFGHGPAGQRQLGPGPNRRPPSVLRGLQHAEHRQPGGDPGDRLCRDAGDLLDVHRPHRVQGERRLQHELLDDRQVLLDLLDHRHGRPQQHRHERLAYVQPRGRRGRQRRRPDVLAVHRPHFRSKSPPASTSRNRLS